MLRGIFLFTFPYQCTNSYKIATSPLVVFPWDQVDKLTFTYINTWYFASHFTSFSVHFVHKTLCSRLSSGKNIFHVCKRDIHFELYFYKANFFVWKLFFGSENNNNNNKNRITYNLSYAQEFFSWQIIYFKGSASIRDQMDWTISIISFKQKMCKWLNHYLMTF